jgi:hypothetical protein
VREDAPWLPALRSQRKAGFLPADYLIRLGFVFAQYFHRGVHHLARIRIPLELAFQGRQLRTKLLPVGPLGDHWMVLNSPQQNSQAILQRDLLARFRRRLFGSWLHGPYTGSLIGPVLSHRLGNQEYESLRYF